MKSPLVNMENATPEKPKISYRQRVGRLIFCVCCLLLFLSLWPWGSYDPRDAEFLAGGLGDDGVVRNWIGYLGAWVSRTALLLFGFASYPAASVLLLSGFRRLLGSRGLRPIRWDYWVALLIITVGAATLFGIWPDMWPTMADKLNIARLPGGVIGQRFCAPENGWMRLVLNPTGSAIVSATLIAGGLFVIWLHDWQDLLKAVLQARAGLTEAPAPAQPAPAPAKPRKGAEPAPAAADKPATGGVLSGMAKRLEERRRRKQEQQRLAREAGGKEVAPRAPAKPRPAPEQAELPVEDSPASRPAPAKSAAASKGKSGSAYKLPPADILTPDTGVGTTVAPAETEEKKQILQETLDSFGIDATLGEATSGPRVTLFEVLPAPGVKVERISQISNNIAMELRATTLRILTPIPGKKSVGIEVPNSTPALVPLSGLMNSQAWKRTKAQIPVLLGRNISGQVVVLDLGKAPHLLIAGATGSGKSVCINLLIMSLLYRFTPDEMRLIMVDPKVVEFRAYESLPHLVVPVISDVKKVPLALRWVINEMQHRYRVLAKVGARNIASFNARQRKGEPLMDDDGNPIPEKLPFIIVIIDELADIMMSAKADVETSLARIAQLSRAVGIHTIIATQRPSVNVITGVIKANFPTRIAFKVTAQVDSRTILDGKGAEALLGQGDMLFRPPGAAGLERIQGGMVEDDEIDEVVAHCAQQAEQEFDDSVFKTAEGPDAVPGGGGGGGDELSDDDEDLIRRATEVIVRDRRATTSYIQRALRIGYNRAAMIIDTLEQRGVIGPQVGTLPREILILGGGDDEPDDDADLNADLGDDEPEDLG